MAAMICGETAVFMSSSYNSFRFPCGPNTDSSYSAGSMSFTVLQVSNDLSVEPAVTLLITTLQGLYSRLLLHAFHTTLVRKT